MSTNEAAERLHLHFKSHDGPCQYCRVVASVDVRDALAHERSAGAAPLDVERLAEALVPITREVLFSGDKDASNWRRSTAEKLAAEYARLSEGTDR